MQKSIKVNPKLETGWKKTLSDQFESDYFKTLKAFLIDEYAKHTVFPPKSQILKALDKTPFDQVKVVILGQDPYHGYNQANGLCFSVNRGVSLPPSLKNIYKELNHDLDIPIAKHGDLSSWAEQGVLLLNATLTVRKSSAGSHQGHGWEKFTDAVINKVNEEKEGVIFLLWGRKAQEKANFIDTEKHFVLTAAHPSPFSAHNGFLGCKHFSKTNQILKQQGLETIDWQLK